MNKRFEFLLLVIAGILSSVAVSIKPNGVFLILIIIIKILYEFYKGKFSVTRIKENLINFAIYFVSFSIFFIFFEPEIILSPRYGLFSLVMTRVYQQGSFLSRTNYNFIEYFIFLIKSYLTNFEIITYSLINGLLILSGVLAFLQNIIKNKKNIITLVLIFSIFIFNYYYARVGFERYLFPSYILLNLISIYGLFNIFRIIRKRV